MEQINNSHSVESIAVTEIIKVRDLRIALSLARYPDLAPLNDALSYLGYPAIALEDGIAGFWKVARDADLALAVRSAELFGLSLDALFNRLLAGAISESDFAIALAALVPLGCLPAST